MKSKCYNALILLAVCSLSLLFCVKCYADSPPKTYKVINDLQFSKSPEFSGWLPRGNRGKIEVADKKLIIETRSKGNKGSAWDTNWIRYEDGFSVQNARVRIEIDVVRQNVYRSMLLILSPKDGNPFHSPSVWINICHTAKGTIQLRRFEEGKHKTLKKLKPGILLNKPAKVILSLVNGVGTLSIGCKTFDLGVLIKDKWIMKPFTVMLGTAQLGNPNAPAQLKVSRITIRSNSQEANKKLMGNAAGKDDSANYILFGNAANRRFQDKIAGDGSDGWTDQGLNDMRYIPRGYQFFRKVPFFISDKLEVRGNARSRGCIILKGHNTPSFPKQSKPVTVNSSAKYLYFLHTSAWGGKAGHIADYIVQYADGSKINIPLRLGNEISDWWNPQKKDINNALVAWMGRNEIKFPVGFYLFKWENVNPGKKIKDIVFASTNSKATPILIAVTASDKDYKIGPEPRVDKEVSDGICEYRQRHKTSLHWTAGPQKVTVRRCLAIAKASSVKSARIDVIRYHSKGKTTVSCTLAGTTQKKTLLADESKASFLFIDKKVLQYLDRNKKNFEISVSFDKPDKIGTYSYESNPNHSWIPKGEDFAHATYAISGVFQVSGWLPIHKYSKYIDLRPKPVQAKPVVIKDITPTVGKMNTDWLGSQLCLNGQWQWQPGGKVDVIPKENWQQIAVPCDVGELIFAKNKKLTGAWFKRELFVPEQWRGRRIVLRFNGVADFAWIYWNGEKRGEHSGIQAFEIDVTDSVKLGEKNTISLYCENVYHGISSRKERKAMDGYFYSSRINKYKGHAYSARIFRGAKWLKPDEIELLFDGKNIAEKAKNIEQVVKYGNGLYFRKQFWDKSILYFSTPGNIDLEKIKNRLEVQTDEVVTKHMTKHEYRHHWRDVFPRRTGPYQDVFLNVSGKTYISDIFIKSSFRKMRLDVEMEFSPIPTGCYVTATVMDAGKTALDMGSKSLIEGNGRKITFAKEWKNPIIWRPSNPHLYYLKAEIHDKNTGKILDRKYIRFGFREFWIDGSRFMFNGKEFPMQGTSISPPHFPSHRAQARWIHSDYNQQANINILRYMGGLPVSNSICDIADEMGMLLEMENLHSPEEMPFWFWDEKGNLLEKQVKIVRDHSVELVRQARNHPSIVTWSADNENLLTRHAGIKKGSTSNEISQKWKDRFEIILKLNAAIKKVDPTRVIHNQGDEGFAYTDYWKDPRVEMLDIHYCQQSDFKNWKKKYGGKPAVSGEVSLGSPFAWTYHNKAWSFLKNGKTKEAAKQFWKRLNAAAGYMTQRIQFLREGVKISGVWPFGACLTYHPLMELWQSTEKTKKTPDVYWPAYSGEQRKPGNHAIHRLLFNYWDPKVPRSMHLRTYNALKDTFPEVEKLEPKFSPEVIVQILDRKGKPLANTVVWLFPKKQPGNPIGVISDAEGKAWFWCKAGAGSYNCWVHVKGKWFTASVTPAPLGEWMQVKTVKLHVDI